MLICQVGIGGGELLQVTSRVRISFVVVISILEVERLISERGSNLKKQEYGLSVYVSLCVHKFVFHRVVKTR